jgi:hypothetical protein
MFRATCDKSVTTSQPVSPPPANLTIPKCPPAQPMCTKPDRANRGPCPPPHTSAHRTPSRQPFHPHPTPVGPAVCYHCANSPRSSLRPSPSVHIPRRAAPTPITAPDPTCRRSRPAPPTQHAHPPSLYQPTTATNTESSSPMTAPAGPATHRPNVAPHRPFSHPETADFHHDR